MEFLEIVCPDCGATYEVKPEQAGKLLHCSCGRYLVAVDKNHQEVVADEEETAPAPPAAATPPAPKVEAPQENEEEYPRTQKLDVAALTGNKPEAPAAETKPKPPAGPNIPPPDNPVIGVKALPPKPKPAEAAPETVFEPKAAAKPMIQLDDNQKMMVGAGAGLLVIVILAAMMLSKSSPKEDTTAAKAQTPATQTSTAPTSTAGATSAPLPPVACGSPDAPRLENGAVISRSVLGSGVGKLEIENLTPNDASVRLVNEGDLTVAWVYVQAGQTAALNTIPLGSHRLFYESGSNWDAQSLSFKCNDSYVELGHALDWTERREDERTLYTSRKITLGKAKVANIDRDKFTKGHIGLGQ